MTAVASTTAPPKVADEEVYDVLRDEWDLLLAVGTGPTPVEVIKERLGGADGSDLEARLELVVEVGLARRVGGEDYELVPAFHQRQEGMSSCLRDLVLRRLRFENQERAGYLVREGLGDRADMVALIHALNDELLPQAYKLGRAKAAPDSKRCLVVFAAAEGGFRHAVGDDTNDETTEPIYELLKQAAIERSLEESQDSSKLWIADVHVSESVMNTMRELFEQFLTRVPVRGGTGCAGYVVMESTTSRKSEACK